jgi:hypothetical protein
MVGGRVNSRHRLNARMSPARVDRGEAAPRGTGGWLCEVTRGVGCSGLFRVGPSERWTGCGRGCVPYRRVLGACLSAQSPAASVTRRTVLTIADRPVACIGFACAAPAALRGCPPTNRRLAEDRSDCGSLDSASTSAGRSRLASGAPKLTLRALCQVEAWKARIQAVPPARSSHPSGRAAPRNRTCSVKPAPRAGFNSFDGVSEGGSAIWPLPSRVHLRFVILWR